MNKILFISTAPTQFKALLPYVKALRNDFIIEFFFDDRQDDIIDEVQVCDRLNITFYFHFSSKHNKNKENIKYNVKLSSVKWLNAYRQIELEEKIYTSFINEIKPSAIFSVQDNFGIKTIFNKICSKASIPSFVTVFTLANQQELGFVFSKDPAYIINDLFKKIVFALYPVWKIKYNDIDVSCETASNVVAKQLSLTAPINPWISVGGQSKYVFFENIFVSEYYQKCGLTKKADLVPHPVYSIFKERLKNTKQFKLEISKQFNVVSDLPVLLCSLPPDFIKNSQFNDYNEMIEFWSKTLGSISSHQIWISLHPRTKLEKVKYLESFGVKIITLPIEELIPICEIFVAQISATIRYALTCRKKVLNFDVFDAKYTEYNGFSSVKTVQSKEEFKIELQKICKGEYDHEVKEFYDQKGNYFGDISIDSNESIVNYFRQAC